MARVVKLLVSVYLMSSLAVVVSAGGADAVVPYREGASQVVPIKKTRYEIEEEEMRNDGRAGAAGEVQDCTGNKVDKMQPPADSMHAGVHEDSVGLGGAMNSFTFAKRLSGAGKEQSKESSPGRNSQVDEEGESFVEEQSKESSPGQDQSKQSNPIQSKDVKDVSFFAHGESFVEEQSKESSPGQDQSKQLGGSLVETSPGKWLQRNCCEVTATQLEHSQRATGYNKSVAISLVQGLCCSTDRERDDECRPGCVMLGEAEYNKKNGFWMCVAKC